MASVQTPSARTANVTTDPLTAVAQDVGACDIQPDLESSRSMYLSWKKYGASDDYFQEHEQEV